MELDGRTAVVTGAARGIGRGLAEALLADGCAVVLSDLDADALAATAGELAEQVGEDRVTTHVTDVAELDAVEALRDHALATFGAVHVVCNNAGVGGATGRSWEVDDAGWRHTIDVDLWSVVHGVRVFTPLLVAQDEGHVVNTASMAGLQPLPFSAPYTAAKHAVVGITDALRVELSSIGSRVKASALCPGWTRTDINVTGEQQHGSDDDPAYTAMMDFVRDAVDDGMAVSDVAAATVDAIREGRFWVLPHTELAAHAARRLDAFR